MCIRDRSEGVFEEEMYEDGYDEAYEEGYEDYAEDYDAGAAYEEEPEAEKE